MRKNYPEFIYLKRKRQDSGYIINLLRQNQNNRIEYEIIQN